MSLTADDVQQLVAAGVTGDALVTACRLIEAAGEKRSSGATRTARWRAKKADQASQSVTERHSGDVTGDAVVTVSSPLPSPLVPPLSPAPLTPPIIPPTNPPSSAQQPSEPDEFDRLDAALRRIPGISGHPVFVDPVIAPIWKLVQAGADFKTQIRPEIERLAKRRKPISSWAFFVPGIRESITGQQDAPAVPDDAEWQKRLSAARRAKAWDVKKWGAMPKQLGCRVPSNLLTADDGNGWTEWKAA